MGDQFTHQRDRTLRSLYCSTNLCTADANLMELLVMIDALRRASQNTLLLLYLIMAMHGKIAKQTTRSICAKLVANLLTAAGAYRY